MERDWKEAWVDRMGLIVTLSGQDRFMRLKKFKADMVHDLTPGQIVDLRICLRERFSPSNAMTGPRPGYL